MKFQVVVMAVIVTFTSRLEAQAPSFVDGFESSPLNSFWSANIQGGSITIPSTSFVHGGSGAVRFSSFAHVYKNISLQHTLPQATYGSVSVWLYDNGADVSSSNYFSLNVGDLSIATMDYDLGPNQNGSHYHYTVDGGEGIVTQIDRTPAWHKFEIHAYPGSWSVWIDGTQVGSGTTNEPFAFVSIAMHAPSWRPAFESSWDDFSISPCPAPPCAQVNSPCASLTINGAGSQGFGPFPVSISTGGAMTLEWSGPSNQPLLLLGSASLNVGQSLGGTNVLDLDVSGLAILLSGFDPVWGGFFFTGGAGSGLGAAYQSFGIPASLAGTSVCLQGVVFDTAGQCSGPGYRTTASFVVSF